MLVRECTSRGEPRALVCTHTEQLPPSPFLVLLLLFFITPTTFLGPLGAVHQHRDQPQSFVLLTEPSSNPSFVIYKLGDLGYVTGFPQLQMGNNTFSTV